MKETNKKQTLRHKDYAANTEVLFALFPLLFMAVYLYGPRPLGLVLAALITARLCDWATCKLRRLPYDRTENSSVVSAVILTLMLPASVPYGLVVFAVAVAVLIGKQVFGGCDQYPFDPAALGYAAAAVSWPQKLAYYPEPFAQLPLFDASSVSLSQAAATAMKQGGVPNISLLDLILGSYAGPMGATCCLVICASAIFLLVRRRISFELPVAFLAACAVASLFFPRLTTAGPLELLRYELLSGGVLFGSVFLLCNPTTAPKNRTARVLYGLLCGFLTMMYRFYGSYELGVCFAVLLANAFSGWLDRICTRPGGLLKRKVNES
ncbi:MAG: RnfABCDGE type electron transport complex subunit D [Pygmaiobacter massiliensis]|nr:RnfABCDGE type electron transport complex subunit D [Pygmaiobacter massiliensis]